MSDPRFARFKTDPRFRRIRKEESKVTVDDRFKAVFDSGRKKSKKGKGRVDKYGRSLSDDHDKDHLRRFYRLEQDEATIEQEAGPDYARGVVLLESSDEEDNNVQEAEEEDERNGIINLGREVTQPIPVPEDSEEAEIDLDEDTYAELDAQAAAYAKENPDEDRKEVPDAQRTRRLAVVNLDWDHVRAVHLYKIFSSLVSPTASVSVPARTSDTTSYRKQRASKTAAAGVVRGRVLSVRIYPSEFGKVRMAREEKEGPPAEIFKKNKALEDEEDINERTIFEVGNEEDYDEDVLRKYQLERLRYFYAIVECDTVEAASHIYSELEGTELERSANVFDLSFVPDDMAFDDSYRDEAIDDLNVPFKGLEFVTDALRHSKVKLTWDEDDPERVHITRRSLSRKEIEENDFKAYIASSTSGSDDEPDYSRAKDAKSVSRDKLRALLLGGDSELPEGWGKERVDDSDVDMEITFKPGLSTAKNLEQDETTLEKYQRKMKEKKRKRKQEMKEVATNHEKEKVNFKDDFFSADSENESVDADDEVDQKPRKEDLRKNKGKWQEHAQSTSRSVSTTEELALLAASNSVDNEPKHFNMRAVLKAEKKQKGKKKKGKRNAEDDNELQENFTIDVKDERFKAIHDDYSYAIDPSNPHFKQTKSMSALLEERSKRQTGKKPTVDRSAAVNESETSGNLKNLVESVKRKSAVVEQPGVGKRRKL
ncbi:hypothetical protein AcV7_000700 [Taiwanofungus camphoratus]|nr:hypothetical protein AcW2_000817 [Antrodia cinnamomea]KAI0961654.1 hypothetical protein AcV7_000700 [Antrodia cinnamomea]